MGSEVRNRMTRFIGQRGNSDDTIGHPPCDWLVRVRSDNPEPSCEAECWTEVECGAPVTVHPQHPTGTICEAGHDRLPMEVEHAPFGPAWEREQQDRFNETGAF